MHSLFINDFVWFWFSGLPQTSWCLRSYWGRRICHGEMLGITQVTAVCVLSAFNRHVVVWLMWMISYTLHVPTRYHDWSALFVCVLTRARWCKVPGSFHHRQIISWGLRGHMIAWSMVPCAWQEFLTNMRYTLTCGDLLSDWRYHQLLHTVNNINNLTGVS